MSEFTKGNWVVDADGTGIYSDSEDCYVVALLAQARSDDQMKANRRLISAAPEMYELLKEGLSLYGSSITSLFNFLIKSRELLARIDGIEP